MPSNICNKYSFIKKNNFEHIAALLIKFKFSSLDIFYDKVVHAKGLNFYRIYIEASNSFVSTQKYLPPLYMYCIYNMCSKLIYEARFSYIINSSFSL